MTTENNDPDRLTDVLDQASDIEMKTTAGRINEVRAKCVPDQLPQEDGTFAVTECEECGNDIGEGRLRVAARNLLCVFCASKEEKRNKRHL